MKQNKMTLSRSLIVGHRRNGRRCYDPGAKRELVEACLQPGISVAGMALAHGLNANLLRKWIDEYRRRVAPVTTGSPAALSAFAPVVPIKASERTDFVLNVILPNGVKLDLRGVGPADLPFLLTCLGGLPCSASNPG